MAPWLRRAAIVFGAGAVAIMLVAGAAFAQLQDRGKVTELYAAAKKEGQVIIWGTQRREVDWIPAAFGKLFSGIDVQFLGDNDIAVKAIAEARAGRHQVDVYQSSLTGILPVVQRDLLTNVDWSPFGIDDRNIAFDGRMAYTSNIVYTAAYNNKLAKDADAPKNWTDILDERYKGKGASSTFLLPRLIGGLGLAWGEDKALQFARDIVAKDEPPAHAGAARIAVAIGRARLCVRRNRFPHSCRGRRGPPGRVRWCRSRSWSASSVRPS